MSPFYFWIVIAHFPLNIFLLLPFLAFLCLLISLYPPSVFHSLCLFSYRIIGEGERMRSGNWGQKRVWPSWTLRIGLCSTVLVFVCVYVRVFRGLFGSCIHARMCMWTIFGSCLSYTHARMCMWTMFGSCLIYSRACMWTMWTMFGSCLSYTHARMCMRTIFGSCPVTRKESAERVE